MYSWSHIQSRVEILALYGNGSFVDLDTDCLVFLDLSDKISKRIEKGEIPWVYLHNDIITLTNTMINIMNNFIQAFNNMR
jgi:hypothetical protein